MEKDQEGTRSVFPTSSKKLINGWAFYDWANSVFPLVITTAVFPPYYEGVTSGMDLPLKNSVIYEVAIAVSFLLIAILSPILSGMADYSGRKKQFMRFFCYLGAASCAGLYLFTEATLWWGLVGLMLASIGFSGSLVFYNAYLPEIAGPKDHDRISAKGFALGYVGSSLLLIFCLVMILQPALFGLSSMGQASRISFLLAGLWWAGFAQITFNVLPTNLYKRPSEGSIWKNGFLELKKAWGELKQQPSIRKYLSAFFVFNMAVQTVMYVATIFAAVELKLGQDVLIGSVLVIQFVAIGGSYLFSWISSKRGNIASLLVCSFFWVIICIIAYLIPANDPIKFYLLAGLVGLVMGGAQSVSRSTFSKLLPETKDHASYFSFYDVIHKLGIVLGMAIFAIVEQVVDVRMSILSLLVFFVIGIGLLIRVGKDPRILPN